MNNLPYELIILGGGPAAVSAGVYAARKELKTLFLTDSFTSQSAISPDIKNWIGEKAISGEDLMKKWEEHLRDYEGEFLTIRTGNLANKIEKIDDGFSVSTDKGETYQAQTILVAVGASRRKLAVPGADTFDQRGLTYCASCDGPLFKNKDVAVIGGGNAGFESAAQLMAYTKSVLLLHRGAEFRADKITVNKTLANPKVTALTNVEPLEVKGDKVVQALVYKNRQTGEIKEVPLQGIFVEIGLIPNTNWLTNILELDEHQAIPVDPRNQRTATDGIWAAGDCAASLYHQNNIAAGQGVTALEDIYLYLKAK